MPRILFVCTANMCRSPLAEVLFLEHLRRQGVESSWSADSAGVAATRDLPATEFSARVAAERGLDLSHHRSQPVDRGLLGSADLVLVMEHAHRLDLQARFPDLAGRVHLLTEMAGEGGDVEDPVGTAIENYRHTADQLTDLFTRGFDRIRALAEGPDSAGGPHKAGGPHSAGDPHAAGGPHSAGGPHAPRRPPKA